MASEWSSSEKLRLLILYKDGMDWAASAEKLNEEYRERPKNFFKEKDCKAEFDRICNEACPRPIAPEEPSQSFKKATVVDSWITHFKEQVTLDSDKMVEYTLVDLRKQTALIERLMSKNDRPSVQEMKAMLASLRAENKKSNRDAAQSERIERVETVLRAKFNQIFKEQRESDGNSDVSMPPASLSISPTKVSSVALQQAFRSPSPMKSPMTSPIRPLAEAIEEADAEMIELGEDAEEPKIELESPVASPLSKATSSSGKREKEKSSTVSPRTAADRAIGEGGLEEEMEEEDEEEEIMKEEPMEVEEAVVEKEKEKPVVTRKSTRVSTTSVETTPVNSGKERKRKDVSPQSTESSASKKEKEKDELKEDEGRSRRSSMRGKPPSTPSTPVAATPTPTPTPSIPVPPCTPEVTVEKEEKEEGSTKSRRSGRVERIEEKKDEKKEDKKEEKKEEKKEDKKEEKEEETKRITRRSVVEKEDDKKEEKETKEEVTFVAPSVASRTRHHRGSDQIEEKEKSEEPNGSKTRTGNRLSLNTKDVSESKESPTPSEKKVKKGEKKEEIEIEEKEKEVRARKETSIALSEKSLTGMGVKKDAATQSEVSIRHLLPPFLPISPSKSRKGAAEKESPSTPVARKSSRVSSASSTSGKRESLMASVEVQTEKVEMRHDDKVCVFFNANERHFNAVCDIEKGKKVRKEIKTETEEEKEKEKPISKRTRGGEISEDEGGSRSGSLSQSEKGTSSRRKESKRDMMTLHLDVDDDTGRYWRANGATTVGITQDTPAPSASKRSRSVMTEITGRRSMNNMDPIKHALFKAIKDLELHRHSSVFKAFVPEKDAPDYYDCVHQPVCLSKLKTDVIDGLINDPVSLKRQFAIMFMNGAMYNSTAHDYWMYAVEMNKESYKPIRDIMPEMMVEEETAQKLTRARRNNEPAFAKDAVLTERDRSMTLDRYFKCESVDADGLESPSDDHRALYTRNKVDSTRKRKI